MMRSGFSLVVVFIILSTFQIELFSKGTNTAYPIPKAWESSICSWGSFFYSSSFNSKFLVFFSNENNQESKNDYDPFTSRISHSLKNGFGGLFKSIGRFVLRYLTKIAVLIGGIVLILTAILMHKKRTDRKKFLTSTRLSLMDKEVQIACKYIEKNFRDPALSVSQMCEELVTGSAFLEILFNDELGMSVDDFLIQVRMNRALSIIESEKNISIDDLILRIGFSDNGEFVNSFQKVTGSSFSDFSKLKNLGN